MSSPLLLLFLLLPPLPLLLAFPLLPLPLLSLALLHIIGRAAVVHD